MDNGQSFFDFAAYAGFTKHLGGQRATGELAALCHIGENSSVLDVGCGAGATACFLVKRYRCRVVGVDISAGMIERSREMARRQGVEAGTEFRVADAQDLPFEDESFDAVITESVTAFPEDKARAVAEYARVIRPGGYVGLNESTWLKVPPPLEAVEWVSQDVGATVSPLTKEEWVNLLERAGLEMISVNTLEVDVKAEARGQFQRYGCLGMLRAWRRMLQMYVRNPAYRRFLKNLREGGVMPENLTDYFGYGIYVGRKGG